MVIQCFFQSFSEQGSQNSFTSTEDKMAIAEVSWQQFLAPNSEIPCDVFFVVKEDGEVDALRIGAHKHLLGGVSPVFRRMLFGSLREGEVVEVRGTTYEAFNTMINYIYKPPRSMWTSSKFFTAPHEEEGNEETNHTTIHCPQKFFDLLDLSEKYEITSMKTELTSYVLENLAITEENVILTARVAKHFQRTFEQVSTKMLAKCLKFLLKKSSKAGDIWNRFWALVNIQDAEEQLRECLSSQEKLAGTPFADLTISHALLKESLGIFGPGTYDQCLYLACSGAHVR